MCKKLVVFFLIAMFTWIPTAFAAENPLPGTIQIRNREYLNNTLSFEAVLSGAEVEGQLVISRYSERGCFLGCSYFPAEQEVYVSLKDVDSSDYIEIIWLDGEHRFLAVHDRLRMSGTAAQGYAEVSDKLVHLLEKHTGGTGAEAADTDNPYFFARLIVRCVYLPDLSRWQLVDQISGPDGLYILQFTTADQAKDCAKYLKALPGVRYAEPDTVVGVVVPPEEGSQANLLSAESGTAGQHLSWGVGLTGISQYAASLAESGTKNRVTVAVVDSGVDIQHPLLKNRITGGFDFIDGGEPMDESGHGTHVAGIIADCTAGLDIQILPVRVLNGFNAGFSSVIALGIYYAADQGVNVINLSLSDSSEYKNIDDAVKYAISKNITVVAASGNQMTDASKRTPAHMDEVITVAAIKENKSHYQLSNWGDAVDISAPGDTILSSVPRGTGSGYLYADKNYDYLSGTSMAAPHVSAAVALLMCNLGTGLTPTQISINLRGAAEDLGQSGWDKYFGAGMLDMRPFIESGAYAALYSDGELVFQKNRATDSGRPVVGVYPVSLVRAGGSEYAGWYENRDRIQKVTFADPIQPVSTALWFYDCANLTTLQGMDRLDTSMVTNMSQMFADCTSLQELDLTSLNTSNVTDMTRMFFGCSALKTILVCETFNTENVTSSKDMFRACTSLTGGRGTAYDSAYTDKAYARVDAGSVPGYFTNPSTGDIYAVLYSDGELVFQNNNRTQPGRTATDVYQVNPEGYSYSSHAPWYDNREKITTASFADNIQPRSCSYWFYNFTKLIEIRNIRNLDTVNATNMSGMFRDCSNLISLDVSNFNTSNVTDMGNMFALCINLTNLDVSSFDTTNVTNMGGMFAFCSNLTSLDVTGFDTINVTLMYSMFLCCSSMTNLDVSSFNTSNVTNMRGMFLACNRLISLDVSNFDTTNVTDIGLMFNDCAKLKTIYASSSFVTDKVGGSKDLVFEGCTSLVGGKGTKYDSSHTDASYAYIDGGPSAPGYFTDANTRLESGSSPTPDMFIPIGN